MTLHIYRDSLLKGIVSEYTVQLVLYMDYQLARDYLFLTQCDIYVLVKSDEGVQVNSFGFNLSGTGCIKNDEYINKYNLTDSIKSLYYDGLDLNALDGISDIEIILVDTTYHPDNGSQDR